MIKKGDKIVIIGLIAIIVAWLIYDNFIQNNINQNRIIQIRIDGKLYKEIPLKDVKEEMIVHIDNEYGVNNIIIDKEGATMSYSNCKNQVCVKTGKITSTWISPILIITTSRLIPILET